MRDHNESINIWEVVQTHWPNHSPVFSNKVSQHVNIFSSCHLGPLIVSLAFRLMINVINLIFLCTFSGVLKSHSAVRFDGWNHLPFLLRSQM